jgi:hypothetical protein
MLKKQLNTPRLTLRRLLSKLGRRNGHGGQSMLSERRKPICSDVSQIPEAERHESTTVMRSREYKPHTKHRHEAYLPLIGLLFVSGGHWRKMPEAYLSTWVQKTNHQEN